MGVGHVPRGQPKVTVNEEEYDKQDNDEEVGVLEEFIVSISIDE